MRPISVIIPTLNEEKTISHVIDIARMHKNVKEIIVVDDSSTDNTVAIAKMKKAKVIYSKTLGKGISMHEGLNATTGGIIAYLDGDLRALAPNVIDILTKPILEKNADFVKSRFGRKAGRITELVAKPLINILFPELSFIKQPLSGMIAVKRSLLKKLKFEIDYGIDVGLLIDAFLKGAKIEEVDIGKIEHKMKPWHKLRGMASQVAGAILKRARLAKRMNLGDLKEIETIEEELEDVIERMVTETKKIALFDMDGVIIDGRFISALGKITGLEVEIERISKNEKDDWLRTKRIAYLLNGLKLELIHAVMKKLRLVKNIRGVIKKLKEDGYIVGIITDSYSCVSEYAKKLLDADFSIANELEIKKGVATGEVRVPSWYVRDGGGCEKHSICKFNAMGKLSKRFGVDIKDFLVIGDNLADICMIEKAGIGIAFMPKHEHVAKAANFIINKKDAIEILKVIS